MKKIKLAIITTCIFSLSINNINSQSVSYKVIEDNPYHHNLDVSFLPFYTDFAPNNNLSLGYGINAAAQYKKLGTVRLSLLRPYTKGTDNGYHAGTVGIFDMPTVNKLNKFLHLELGATYNLSERTKTKSKKVVLSSYTSNSGRTQTTTTKYLMVPATVRKIIGIRGGIYNYHTVITARDHGDIDGDLGIGTKGVISTDGTRFGGAALLNPIGTPADPFFNTESATNLRVLGLYGGISTSSYHRIMIETDGYGIKGGTSFVNFFADAMIAPPRIDDFEGADGKKHDVHGKGSQGFKTRPFGARVGYEYMMAKKKIGYYTKTELGFKPGMASSKFYVSLSFGICFVTRVKQLASAE